MNVLAIAGCVLFLGLFFLLNRYMNNAKVPSERYVEETETLREAVSSNS